MLVLTGLVLSVGNWDLPDSTEHLGWGEHPLLGVRAGPVPSDLALTINIGTVWPELGVIPQK